MRYLIDLPLYCLVVPLSLQAHLLRTGESVPLVKFMHQREVIYIIMSLVINPGVMHAYPERFVSSEYIAARTSAREINAALIEPIRMARLLREYYQTTTIVDRRRRFFAIRWFIRHQIEASLRRTLGCKLWYCL